MSDRLDFLDQYWYFDVVSVDDFVISYPEPVVFPNPFSSYIIIDLNGRPGEFDLSLYNISGVLVHQQKFSHGGQIDLSSLKNGVYLIRIAYDNDELFYQKIIKTD
jgi:hypothetical protein